MDEYTYYLETDQVYFKYKIFIDHREGTKIETRRYYHNGLPCRCLKREGPEEKDFLGIPDIQYNCSAD